MAVRVTAAETHRAAAATNEAATFLIFFFFFKFVFVEKEMNPLAFLYKRIIIIIIKNLKRVKIKLEKPADFRS